MLLVVGAARSGTGFYAGKRKGEPLLAWEFNFTERVLTTGLCSWYMAAWKRPRFEYPEFMHHARVPDGWTPTEVVHLTRNPLQCIPSLERVTKPSRRWARQYIPTSPRLPDPEWGARYWCAWNRLIWSTEYAPGLGWPPVVHVEDVPAEPEDTTYNTRLHARYKPGELEERLGPDLWGEVLSVAEQLGYRSGELK